MYRRATFLFRRDLRLADNTGLLRALSDSEEVVPLFIFDPRQVEEKQNPYFSPRAFGFMVASLRELDAVLREKGSRLYLAAGKSEDVVRSLKQDDVEALYVNADYTPFARARDEALEEACRASGIAFVSTEDYALAPLHDVKTGSGTSYTVYTPFMRTAKKYGVREPRRNTHRGYYSGALTSTNASLEDYREYEVLPRLLRGGREEALTLIRRSFLKDYENARNLPATQGTSRLSAHLKFGTLSVREVYHHALREVGEDSQFISELYWRDFYLYIGVHFPHVFGRSFLEWGDNIEWLNNETHFVAWKEGKTGVPIVDAGMRELRETGWMHNRVRMIVASYLTKNLLIDWRWGERYFATQLIDYDPSSNNGGWQWSASVGADPRPLRIFNPYAQASRYDPEAVYIKRWVPELSDVPIALLTDGTTQDLSVHADYPTPIVDQKETYRRAYEVYKQAKH